MLFGYTLIKCIDLKKYLTIFLNNVLSSHSDHTPLTTSPINFVEEYLCDPDTFRLFLLKIKECIQLY